MQLLSNILIILAFFLGLLLTYYEGLQKGVESVEPEIVEVEKVVAVENNTEPLTEELAHTNEVIRYKEEIIDALVDELNDKGSGRAAIIKTIKRSQLELQNRIKPTLAQLNQIESWLKNKDKIPDKAEFYSYLEKQVFTPDQYQDYLDYERDLRYSERLRTLSELVKIVKLPDETLDSFYNHNFPTNEEALAAILSEDQFKLWKEYNK